MMKTYKTIDKLEILRTLRITVPSTILSTSLVGGVRRETAIRRHLGKVYCAVETTRKVRYVDVKGKLLAQWFENFVFGVAYHQIQARTNVCAYTGGNEIEFERVAGGSDTICAAVVGAIQRAVRSAGRWVGALSRGPLITSEAVRVAADNDK